MTKYLIAFERKVDLAELGSEGGLPSEAAEELVRECLQGWAKDAPLFVVVAMARAAIAERRREDKGEAEAN